MESNIVSSLRSPKIVGNRNEKLGKNNGNSQLETNSLEN